MHVEPAHQGRTGPSSSLNFLQHTTLLFRAQGLHTKVAQVAAAALGLPLSAVYIAETATDKVPNASPTAASASSDMYGAAGAATYTLSVDLLSGCGASGGRRASWLPDDAGSSHAFPCPRICVLCLLCC